jgi:hypothetical protein
LWRGENNAGAAGKNCLPLESLAHEQLNGHLNDAYHV